MRAPRFSPRELRTVRLGGVALLAAVLVRGALLPFLAVLEATQAGRDEARALLARELGLAAAVAEHASELQNAARHLESVGPRLLPGATLIVRQTALLQVLERTATAARVQIDELELLPPRESAEPVSAASVRILGQADLESLLTLLVALEAAPLLIDVESVQITTATPYPAADGGPELLRFDFTASGFGLDPEATTRIRTLRAGSAWPPPVPVQPTIQDGDLLLREN